MEDMLTSLLNLTVPESPFRLGNESNRGPGPRKPPRQSPNCGTCETECIYECIRLLFVIGVLANTLTIFRVISDKKLRSPTFTALASLAVADGLHLLLKLVLCVDAIITQMTCGTKIWFKFKHLPGILALLWFSASLHVSLLAAMRYVILVHPLKMLTLLSQRRIIFISASIWVLSGITFGGIMISNEIEPISKENNKGTMISIVTWSISYFTPLALTAILHIVKLLKVRKAPNLNHAAIRATDSQARNQRSADRMTKIIIFVILASVVLPLPVIVLAMLKDMFDIHIRDNAHVYGISQIMFLLNFSINPFIYSFSSKTFRESLRRMMNRRMTKSSNQSNLVALGQNTKTPPMRSQEKAL